MSVPKILIVDDEEDILDILEYNLEKEGFKVSRAEDGIQAVDKAVQEKPDLIVMDIMMPRMDGVAACYTIRENPELNDTRIAFLTARSEEYAELAGFDAGADDYIFKPIRPRVFVSRIKALLRRFNHNEGNTIQIHDLEIVRDEYVVKRGTELIYLPRKEFELLYYLASRPGKVFKREDLLYKIWENVHVTDRTVDVHIRKLRGKIGSEYIQTIKGVGYKFLPEHHGP
ncbi:MAG: response regulator transcription factor [Bacteroidota bacterium]